MTAASPHVAILGNGVAGITAALRLRKRRPDWRITVISGESTHHWSRPALMYVFMGHVRYRDTKPYEDSFWDEQRIDLVRDWVTRIDVEGKLLERHRGPPIHWDKLLIATGSKSNRFGWPGQDLDGVQGLWGLQDLGQLHATCERTRHAVIVGGGLIGIELAEMVHSRGIHVTFLVREASYWDNVLPAEESAMVNRVIREAGMDLRLGSNLREIVDDGTGKVAGVVVEETGERLDCQLVGLTPGVSPNVDLLEGSGIETGRGVLVDWSLRTNVPDVHAAGDCAELVNDGDRRNTIQQVWYTGKLQGEVVGDVLAGYERTYDPGVWYNSAKFLDLEYHTYGRVNQDVPGERNLYWEHPDHRHALRVVHTPDDGVIGFNTMGWRFRHEVCERWIREGRDVPYVLERLEEAHFEPEFFRRHEADVRRAFGEPLR